METMFAPMDQMDAEEIANANVRPFVGDGTKFLFVPGLKSVSSVRVGTTNIPLVETRKIPMSADDIRPITFPLIDLQLNAQGQPILRRSVFSNDGIWQKGVNIYVGGEWDEGVQEPTEDTPTAVRRGRPPLTN